MGALLEEQLPCAGPDVAGRLRVFTSGGQNMKGKTGETRVNIAVANEGSGKGKKALVRGKKGNKVRAPY